MTEGRSTQAGGMSPLVRLLVLGLWLAGGVSPETCCRASLLIALGEHA